MYNGIGLQTPRGSGTNGYIQANKFLVKPRPVSSTSDGPPHSGGVGESGFTRKPNKDILEHDRKRRIQLRLLLLEEALVDQGYTHAEISQRLADARMALEAETEAVTDQRPASSAAPPPPPRFSDTQTHQIAARKEKQLETLRAALGIKHEDESSEHEIQEQKQQEKIRQSETEKSGAKLQDHKSDLKENNKQKAKNENAQVDEEKNSKRGKEKVEDLRPEKGSKGTKDDWKKNDGGQRSRIYESERCDKSIGRIIDADGIDNDRSGENIGGEKKLDKNTHHFDSDARIVKKNAKRVLQKEKKQSKDYDRYDSDSARDSGKENTRREAEKCVKKRKRHDKDPETDGAASKIKSQVWKRQTEGRRHGFVDSESDTDVEGESGRKLMGRQNKPTGKCWTGDSDNGSERKDAINEKRWCESGDSDSDTDDEEKSGRKGVEKHCYPSRKRRTNDSDNDAGKKNAIYETTHGRSSKSWTTTHDISRENFKGKTETLRRKKRRHDTDNDSSDTDSGKEYTKKLNAGRKSGWHHIDNEGSDYQKIKKKGYEKKKNSERDLDSVINESKSHSSDCSSDSGSDQTSDYGPERLGWSSISKDAVKVMERKSAQEQHTANEKAFRSRPDRMDGIGKLRSSNRNGEDDHGKRKCLGVINKTGKNDRFKAGQDGQNFDGCGSQEPQRKRKVVGDEYADAELKSRNGIEVERRKKENSHGNKEGENRGHRNYDKTQEDKRKEYMRSDGCGDKNTMKEDLYRDDHGSRGRTGDQNNNNTRRRRYESHLHRDAYGDDYREDVGRYR